MKQFAFCVAALALLFVALASPVARAQDVAAVPDTIAVDDTKYNNGIAGEFTPGKGFDIFKSKRGSLNISV